jgi:hypothetical protein
VRTTIITAVTEPPTTADLFDFLDGDDGREMMMIAKMV